MRNYIQTLSLLFGVAIGAACGALAGPEASIVKPVGEIFLNLTFVLVVPVVFFSVANSVRKLSAEKKLWRVLSRAALVFLAGSIVAGVLTWIVCGFWNPLGGYATRIPPERTALEGSVALGGRDLLKTIENMFTVSDFQMILSKDNLVPLIVFSALFGAATSLSSTRGEAMERFLESGMEVVMEFMRLLMYAAPVCLGCYFADLVGNLGGQIVSSFVNSMLLYLVVTAILFFGVNSLYVALAGGKDNLSTFWRNITEPSLLAVATCSSAATIPASIKSARKMGVDDSVAESVIPLGINLNKDGSVVSAVLKTVFVVSFYGLGGYGCLEIVAIAILASLVVGAIPVGGMTAEILICSILGVDPEFAATLLVISTLVDIPATLLNTADNLVSAVWVDKLCKKAR
ncbi:MAG: dicarboxylate/amino acid:cation symporter [Bacteroidales bacterium]|nr:dicarboxylate/amino acid:cation symporter [Bacteroidales bacterium]